MQNTLATRSSLLAIITVVLMVGASLLGCSKGANSWERQDFGKDLVEAQSVVITMVKTGKRYKVHGQELRTIVDDTSSSNTNGTVGSNLQVTATMEFIRNEKILSRMTYCDGGVLQGGRLIVKLEVDHIEPLLKRLVSEQQFILAE